MTAIQTADCSVELVVKGRSRTCRSKRTVHYDGQCACGHDIAGWACAACLMAATIGCLTCWENDRHVCPVTFEDGAA